MSELFLLNLDKKVTSQFTPQIFQQIFKQDATLFWNFWQKRCNGCLYTLYQEIATLDLGIYANKGYKEKLGNFYISFANNYIEASGFKLVKN
jgi:hypothetical protein